MCFLCFQWVSLSSISPPLYPRNVGTYSTLWQWDPLVFFQSRTKFWLFYINRVYIGHKCVPSCFRVFSAVCPSLSPTFARSVLLVPHSSSAHVDAKGKVWVWILSTVWHHSEFTYLLMSVCFLSCVYYAYCTTVVQLKRKVKVSYF